MTGAKDSSTPWYLTIGNPFSPWLSTNHIVVKSAEIESSTEMGYQDMPTWIKVKFSCEFSRSLGRQELMRMLNNTYTRTYTNSNKVGTSQESIQKQKEIVTPETLNPGSNANFAGSQKTTQSEQDSILNKWNSMSAQQKKTEQINNSQLYNEIISL
jgi:hypothetical protein